MMSQRRWEEEEDSFHPPVSRVFCPLLRFIFPLQRVKKKKKGGCCSDDAYVHRKGGSWRFGDGEAAQYDILVAKEGGKTSNL